MRRAIEKSWVLKTRMKLHEKQPKTKVRTDILENKTET